MAETKLTPLENKNIYFFKAYRGSNSSYGATAQSDNIVCDVKVYDPTSNYSTSTGLFTCPVTGYYVFNAKVRVDSIAATYLQLHIYGEKSNDRWCSTGQQVVMNGTTFAYCTAGTTVGLQLYHNNTATLVGTSYESNFSGYLVTQ